jgi:hypothetical protein
MVNNMRLIHVYTYNSVDCIVADDNPLLDFISIKNLNFQLPLHTVVGIGNMQFEGRKC